MALTLANLSSHISHAIGGGALSSLLSATQIVNEAGRQLVRLHNWSWLDRPTTTLSLVSAQNYVLIPAALMRIEQIAMTDGTLDAIRLTTMQNLVRLRNESSGVSPAWGYYAAVSQPTQVNVTSSPPQKRLELWPTPSASVSDAITLLYASDWTELTTSTDIPNVPVAFEFLLVQLCRVIAQGYEDGSWAERLMEFKASPVIRDYIAQDSAIAIAAEPIEGGHCSGYAEASSLDSTVAGPS